MKIPQPANMICSEKKNVLGIMINVTDYDHSVESVIEAARSKKPFAVTALAVHGLMCGVLDRELRYRLNSFDLVVPDGQPVRWALNWLHHARLRDRVYGPNLTLAVCRRAEQAQLSVFFYGATPEILEKLTRCVSRQFPRLNVAGSQSSKFRRISPAEKTEIIQRIRGSGASIVFVGLGCPRQEVWVYEFCASLGVPVVAVGAAFAFIAGMLPQAPPRMQDLGLEWLFRLWSEPMRLWRRYLFLNPTYLCLLLLQRFRIMRFCDPGVAPIQETRFG